jgi:hypothetical protein
MKVAIAVAAMTASASFAQTKPARGKWTVMVYMTANNNLESDALADFQEMAAISYPAGVEVVIQLKRADNDLEPPWRGVRRYHVDKGGELDDASKIGDLGEADMADSHTLADFISWAAASYPAEQYALILWCHGSGWKHIEIMAPRPGASSNAAKSIDIGVPDGVSDYSFKAASQDGSDQLYNAELACAIRYALGGRKLDLLAFDSCLMAMIETAYAVRNVADVMVASEDLVPHYGFNYTTLFTALNAEISAGRPVSALDFGRLMIDKYKEEYTALGNDNRCTTLSAVDLSAMPVLSAAISSFSRALQAALPRERKLIQDARNGCANFAPPHPDCGRGPSGGQTAVFYHIDLFRFADLIAQATPKTNPQLKKAAAGVLGAIRLAIGDRNFAAANRSGAPFGASGLAIYFPPDGGSYASDPFGHNIYDKPVTNPFLPYPLDFVGDQQWADFLHAYYKEVPQ